MFDLLWNVFSGLCIVVYLSYVALVMLSGSLESQSSFGRIEDPDAFNDDV
jgi:hypothetical protein